jgi:hypothetical protein
MCGCQIFKKDSIPLNVFNFKAWAYIGVTNNEKIKKRFGLVNATYIAPERQNK